MKDAQVLIQTMLLMSNKLMLTTDEISGLDWSVFDGIDLKVNDAKRGNAIYEMGRQIDRLRSH